MDILNTIADFFISSAYADAPAAAHAQPGSGFQLTLMLGMFVLFMYFAVWRPQSKRAKEHRNLMNSLAKGDEVVTAGGILGKIVKVADNYIVIAIADNIEVIVQKSSIANALPKGTIKSV